LPRRLAPGLAVAAALALRGSLARGAGAPAPGPSVDADADTTDALPDPADEDTETDMPALSGEGDATPAPRPPARLSPQAAHRAAKTISLTGTYALYSFLVPSKHGAQLTYLHDDRWSWELEYLDGSFGVEKFGLDLLSVEERLLLVKLRKYWSGSFNLTAGLGERRFAFGLGDTIVDRIPESARPGRTRTEVYRWVADVGIGNRWQLANGVVLGADWIELALPFGKPRTRSGLVDAIEDDTDRENANRVVSFLQYLPTLTVVKVTAGFSF
jgi:hypothetical protein